MRNIHWVFLQFVPCLSTSRCQLQVQLQVQVLCLEGEELLIVLKCFQIILVSFEFSTEFVKFFRFAFRINLVVSLSTYLFRNCLYSDQFLEYFILSLVSPACPFSGVYQSGRWTDFTRHCLTGACLSNCFMIMGCQIVILIDFFEL